MKDQSGEESDVADSLSKKITETCSQYNMEIIDDFYRTLVGVIGAETCLKCV